jgi:hypothetical protein
MAGPCQYKNRAMTITHKCPKTVWENCLYQGCPPSPSSCKSPPYVLLQNEIWVGVRHKWAGAAQWPDLQAGQFFSGHFGTGAAGQTSSPPPKGEIGAQHLQMSIDHRSWGARPSPHLPAILEASRVWSPADVWDYCARAPWRRVFGSSRQRCNERESLCDSNTF